MGGCEDPIFAKGVEQRVDPLSGLWSGVVPFDILLIIVKDDFAKQLILLVGGQVSVVSTAGRD